MTQHIVRPPPFVHLEYLCQFLCGHSVISYMHSAPSYKHILSVFFQLNNFEGGEKLLVPCHTRRHMPLRSLNDRNGTFTNYKHDPTHHHDHGDRPIGVENNTKFGL